MCRGTTACSPGVQPLTAAASQTNPLPVYPDSPSNALTGAAGSPTDALPDSPRTCVPDSRQRTLPIDAESRPQGLHTSPESHAQELHASQVRHAQGLHIALAFYGLTRSLRFTIDSIRENIFAPLTAAGHTFDVHLHTYNLEHLRNRRSSESDVKLDPTEWQLLEPASHQVTDQVRHLLTCFGLT